jgi:hypothetical protein
MTRQHDAGMEIKKANREEPVPLLSQSEAPGLAVLDPPTHRQPEGTRQTHQLSPLRPTPDHHLEESGSPRVRLLMSAADAKALANLLSAQTGTHVEHRILDQLWLRTVLIEQWRRTRIAERGAFRERADRVLSALEP